MKNSELEQLKIAIEFGHHVPPLVELDQKHFEAVICSAIATYAEHNEVSPSDTAISIADKVVRVENGR